MGTVFECIVMHILSPNFMVFFSVILTQYVNSRTHTQIISYDKIPAMSESYGSASKNMYVKILIFVLVIKIVKYASFRVRCKCVVFYKQIFITRRLNME